MHLVHQTEMARKRLKNKERLDAIDGRIPPWMVDFGQ